MEIQPACICSTNVFKNSKLNYLLWIVGKDAIQDQVGPEKWPLTFNVFKKLQLSRFIIQPVGVLLEKRGHVFKKNKKIKHDLGY